MVLRVENHGKEIVWLDDEKVLGVHEFHFAHRWKIIWRSGLLNRVYDKWPFGTKKPRHMGVLGFFGQYFKEVKPVREDVFLVVIEQHGGFQTYQYYSLLRPGYARRVPWPPNEAYLGSHPSFLGKRCMPLLWTEKLDIVVLEGRNQELVVQDAKGNFQPLSVHRRPLERMGLSKDGRWVVTAHRGSKLKISSTQTGAVVEERQLSSPIKRLIVHDDVDIELWDGDCIQMGLPT